MGEEQTKKLGEIAECLDHAGEEMDDTAGAYLQRAAEHIAELAGGQLVRESGFSCRLRYFTAEGGE